MGSNSVSGARSRSVDTVCVCIVRWVDNASTHAVRVVLGIVVGTRGLGTVDSANGHVVEDTAGTDGTHAVGTTDSAFVVDTCSHPVGLVDTAS